MLSADQIVTMYPDLADPDVESALALVHQRFSTNTFPSWPLAHPYRYIAHNGEINTLRGNINWMRAREALCRSDLLGNDLRKVLPVTREGLSDSATFDNVLEFLVMNGRSLPHAILMMIPEPWQNHEAMSPERRAFYEYHASLMEPWDGPASIAFTDGTVIGALLDRNGLRPSRYYVTKDDLVIMASEVGVLDVPPESILVKERLHPGRIFLVDTGKGRIVDDEEIKGELAGELPYGTWLRENSVSLDELPEHPAPTPAARPDPRGAGHRNGVHGRAGGEPPRPGAGVLSANRAQGSGALERRARQAHSRRRARLQIVHAADALAGHRGRRRARARAREPPEAGEPGDRRRGQPPHPVRSGAEP